MTFAPSLGLVLGVGPWCWVAGLGCWLALVPVAIPRALPLGAGSATTCRIVSSVIYSIDQKFSSFSADFVSSFIPSRRAVLARQVLVQRAWGYSEHGDTARASSLAHEALNAVRVSNQDIINSTSTAIFCVIVLNSPSFRGTSVTSTLVGGQCPAVTLTNASLGPRGCRVNLS